MKFHTVILQDGKNTGIPVPEEVVQQLGAGKRFPVRVTVGSHTYRNTVAPYGGRYMISLSAENRDAAGVSGGDEVEIGLELDTEPREMAGPQDFQDALAAHPGAKDFFDTLSFSKKRYFVDNIESAKTPETRMRRIDKAVTTLGERRER